MAKITVNDLLSAGVHFGHQTKRWNPKMEDYVYGVKNGIYIIDLAKTMHQLAGACNYLQHTVANGGDILFVGTKCQAQNVVKEAAEKPICSTLLNVGLAELLPTTKLLNAVSQRCRTSINFSVLMKLTE